MDKLKKAKRPPRTVKEKKFVKEYIANGGNGVQAALKAYDTTNYKSASVIAGENLEKLGFDHYFAKAGLTDEVIAQNITRIALTAKKQNQFTGEIDTDDAIQLRAAELAVKIQGKFAPQKAPVDNEGKTVIPILTNVFSYNGDPQAPGTEETD